jgi:hypothetical protein
MKSPGSGTSTFATLHNPDFAVMATRRRNQPRHLRWRHRGGKQAAAAAATGHAFPPLTMGLLYNDHTRIDAPLATRNLLMRHALRDSAGRAGSRAFKRRCREAEPGGRARVRRGGRPSSNLGTPPASGHRGRGGRGRPRLSHASSGRMHVSAAGYRTAPPATGRHPILRAARRAPTRPRRGQGPMSSLRRLVSPCRRQPSSLAQLDAGRVQGSLPAPAEDLDRGRRSVGQAPP